MSTPIIQIKNLTKIYTQNSSRITALSNISFKLEKGQSLAIVGPSGSGKTTLLELMGGLNQATSGEVIIDGKEVGKGSDKAISEFRNQTLGFVFQMMHLQDYYTAVENVSLPLIAKGQSFTQSRSKALEMLEKVGLGHRLDQYPSQLSGGEMQRVAIARALVNDPKIIMADEPTGKLDRDNSDKVMQIFHDISESGVSIILITHDPKVASTFSNVITLEHGVLKKK